MTILIVSIIVVLVVSALCSLSEAALYAVRMPYVRQLVEGGHTAGTLLEKFKKNMEQPITAILILNTAANTAGAAVAGAQARQLFGDASVIWFSASFTVAVLFLSEIIPKVAGVALHHGRQSAITGTAREAAGTGTAVPGTLARPRQRRVKP